MPVTTSYKSPRSSKVKCPLCVGSFSFLRGPGDCQKTRYFPGFQRLFLFMKQVSERQCRAVYSISGCVIDWRENSMYKKIKCSPVRSVYNKRQSAQASEEFLSMCPVMQRGKRLGPRRSTTAALLYFIPRPPVALCVSTEPARALHPNTTSCAAVYLSSRALKNLVILLRQPCQLCPKSANPFAAEKASGCRGKKYCCGRRNPAL